MDEINNNQLSFIFHQEKIVKYIFPLKSKTFKIQI